MSVHLEWVYGAIGKTYYVHEKENYNLCSMHWNNYNRMFKMYGGEDVVLFDNFDSYNGKIPISFFINMFRGQRQFQQGKLFAPKKVYIITTKKPNEDDRLFNLFLSNGGKLTEIKEEVF
jgi:hypothetical protein